MSKNKKQYIYLYLFIGLGFAGLFGFLYHYRSKEAPRAKEFKTISYNNECDHIHNASAPIEPAEKLNDLNELQIIHARTNGLKHPFATDREFDNNINQMVKNSILVKVNESRYYQLKSLTHSQPYLIPEAIDMLNELGYKFEQKLEEKHHCKYKFRITSLLRTGETQAKLSHRNGNATRSLSCHIYGTTLDISYKNFVNATNDSIEPSYEGVQALTQTLIEMRRECKLLCVRERHQSCFHITVVVCKPNKNN